ncbi:MAG: hypothetical protein HZB38_15885 [Planctomycetes bacterium]|nr:hypothetical protein [Planctomycetota bacterium]
MAIQFRCAGCSQPIEVDDQYAGREAQCPYCRRVVTVPQQTTFDSSDTGLARPASGAAVPLITGLPPLPEQGVPTTDAYWQPAPPAPPNPRVGTARRIGNIALVCAVLSASLFVLATVLCTVALLPDWIRLNNQQPTPEQLNACRRSPA